MTLTHHRTLQYIGILLALAAIAAGYWYFSVRASTKVNKTATGSLTSGLVGYWTFDGADTTSTTITDKSGNGYNATRNGVTTVTPGRIGQAMSLDGEDVTNITASGSSLNNLTQFTACAWVNPATFTNPDSDPESIILGKVWYLRVNNSGQVRFSISTSGAYPTAFSSVNLATNRWQHLCGVAYGVGTEPKLFLDGVDVSSNTDGGAGTQTSDSAHPFTIGSQHDNDSYVNYKGKIDEVRIYNRTLSATEVAGLYDMGKVTINTRPGDDVLEEGLAGYWKLDESSGTSAGDASGNASTGTLTNMEDPGDWVAGRIGNSLNFDGSNEYVNLGAPAALNLPGAMTACAWIYAESVPISDARIIANNDTGGGVHQYSIEVETDRAVDFFWTNNAGTVRSLVTTGPIIEFNAWYHVCAVRNSTTAGTIYSNGIAQPTTVSGGAVATTGYGNTTIGRAGSTSASYFDGKIDEVRVYHRALSAEEVALLYRETHPDDPDTHLVGYWTFDGADVSGTTAIDRGRGGNAATNTGGSVQFGKIGQAMSFDQSADYMDAGSAASLDDIEDQGGGGVSYGFWMNLHPAGSGNDRGVLAKGSTIIAITGSNQLVFSKGHATQNMQYLATSFGAGKLGAWHYVVVTWNGGSTATSSVKIYLDGAEVGYSYYSDGTGAQDSDAGDNLYLGAEGPSYHFLDGALDDVRVYTRVLAATEVHELYRIGEGSRLGVAVNDAMLAQGLGGYWKLDENTGISASDASGNGNSGTLTNSPTWTTGHFGAGLDFDNTNDYVAIADPGSGVLDYVDGDDFTMTFWYLRDTDTTNDYIVAKQASVGDPGYRVYLLSGDRNAVAAIHDGTDACEVETSDVPVGSWANGALTWKSHVLTYYSNGIEMGSVSCPAVGSLANSEPFTIGANSGGTNNFDGKLDDVRVYRRALSTDEIRFQYSGTTPPSATNDLVGHWTFDGSDMAWQDTATEVKDRSNNLNHGDATNMSTASAVPGRIGQALTFDGVNQSVDMGSSAVYANLNTKTVSAWIKPSGLTTYRGITGIGTWAFQICSNDATDCNGTTGRIVYYHEFSGTEGKWILGANSVTANQWAHVVVAYDRTSTVNDPVIYVNGVSQSVTELSAPTGTANNETGTSFQIGFDGYAFAMGAIDDVRVYNRILSADEVTQLYNLGR